MMRKWLGGILVGTLAWAGAATAATYTDAATNYPGGSWTNGSNGGAGFGPWAIVADNGGSGWAGCGIWDSAGAGLNMGEAFGYVGKVGYVNIDRDFTQALNVGDSFALDFGVNWDSDIGNKGFGLFANGVEVVNVNHGGFPGEIKLNGANALVNYGTQTMRWTFTQVAANQISVYATGRDGTETFATTVTTASAYGYVGHVRFYSSGLAADAPDQRQSYFDNLTLEQEGTPPPDPLGLTFTSGTWNPQALGDYEFVVERIGAVGDDLILTSSNPDAVTVPAGATFISNSVAFNATVVSLTSGPAALVASNEETGVWAEYVVTPVAPVLAIGGPWEIFALGPAGFILQRVGAVGDVVSLSSSAPGVLSVPASATFGSGETQTTFNATANAFGAATITATNAASGAWATFDVTVAEPAIAIEGPATVWTGGARFYTLRRNSAAGVGANVNLSSSDEGRLTVPATVSFPGDALVAIFAANGVAPGAATITADNDDVEPATFDATVTDMPGALAADHSGNYAPATFVDGSNLGFGFGAWDFWNEPASLGDSTAGGGGDLNDTNGVAFRFMGDGAGGYCNARRDLAEALKPGDVMSFTFTYNWVGGGRGVDVFSAGGQFANLINVGEGDAFSVNGTVISRDYTPGAVVYVEIAQQADGIEVYLTRASGGGVNLAYVTNVVHGEGATGVSMYCGGYVADPIENNVNFAIFMNALRVVGEEPTRLSFTGGTWDPAALGDYPFELTRSGAVDDFIVLSSDNEAAVTVPEGAMFPESSRTLTFDATVVSLTAGSAKIVASNAATGVWAEYSVYPVAPALGLDGPWLVYGLGAVQYTLTRTGAVGDEITLSSSATNVATVPATATFGEGETAITFLATGVGYGFTSLVATDAVSGATADYGVTFEVNPNQPIGQITFNPATGDISFEIPAGFGLGSVYGADCQLVGGDWDWQLLVQDVDYVVDAGVVTIVGDAAQRRIIRIGWLPD
jgi:hypothetical protein